MNVSHTGHRLDLYKRLAAARDSEAVDEVLSHMVDRYGRPPREIEALVRESKLRIALAGMGVLSVLRHGKFIEIVLRETCEDTVQKLESWGFVQTKPDKFSAEIPVSRLFSFF